MTLAKLMNLHRWDREVLGGQTRILNVDDIAHGDGCHAFIVLKNIERTHAFSG